MNYIYLDNAASTKPMPVVNKNFITINNGFYANPSASHIMGTEAEKLVDRSRSVIASFIGMDPENIIFTSGGTESINMALRGIYKAYGKKRNGMVTTKAEHAATYETLLDMKKEGAEISFIEFNKDNSLDMDSLEKLLSKKPLIISIIHVNNETGLINPIGEISRFIRSSDPEIFIHTDIVQSFGKIDLKEDLKYVDLFSCSAHKIHGPKGIGLLGIKKNIQLSPITTGGGQEGRKRPGTINLPLIYGFAGVVPEIERMFPQDLDHVKSIKKYLIDLIAGSSLEHRFYFDIARTSPYILNISFPGVRSEILMHFLEENGIIISAGAACSSKAKGNRILEAYGIPQKETGSAVRISFSRYTSRDEIDKLYKTLCSVIPKIKHGKGGR
jgi:cysteine desulfurase